LLISLCEFHFPKIWFETSDFSRKRSHCAPQAL
jgi:hypothetical protein